MPSRRVRLVLGLVLSGLCAGYLIYAGLFYAQQRRLLYLPTHQATAPDLAPWLVGGQLTGYSRESVAPQAVWLILQGNAGQAGPRGYFQQVPPTESLYILEYPGYGRREGEPTRDTVDAAAIAAYRELRRRFPRVYVGVVGESFGSGPACGLTRESPAPDSLTLFVPLARTDLIIGRFVPLLPMRWLLRDNWDNVAALRGYSGPVTIFAAENDEVIPREHTLLLAGSVPGVRLVWLPGGHVGHSESPLVRLAR
ncbi:MAG: hypothetical protein PSV13_05195 [Lacunisphaera sp.]|nr:hypothetical protein [Lacunisphaera sp.]